MPTPVDRALQSKVGPHVIHRQYPNKTSQHFLALQVL
jgi:hypothetical protein